MAKPKTRRPPKKSPDNGVVTSAEPLESASEAEVSPEEGSKEKTAEEKPAALPEGDIRVICQDEGAVISDADGKPVGKFPQKLPRPKKPTLYWVDGPQCKRRQLVLRADSPSELEVALRRVSLRTMPAPVAKEAKAAAKKHADAIEKAIAAAEANRGKPGFRKPPKQEVPDIKITARQYVRSRGFRWEQCAGFLHDMKVQHGAGAKKTRPEWLQLWEAFKTRPVK